MKKESAFTGPIKIDKTHFEELLLNLKVGKVYADKVLQEIQKSGIHIETIKYATYSVAFSELRKQFLETKSNIHNVLEAIVGEAKKCEKKLDKEC